MVALKNKMFKPKNKVKIKWQSDFAYAIGLLASDGNLSKDGRHMNLKSAEKEMVNNFKKALNLSNPVKSKIVGQTSKKHFYIQFSDVIFYKFLNTIGLYPAKSKTIKKVEVPTAFFADFLRGLFDGDGTFYSYYDKRWPNSFVYQISFASASYDFIFWLKNKLAKLYGVKGFIRKGDGVFNLRYVKRDTKKIFEKMYHENNPLFLSRKYFKINSAIEKPR